MEDQDRKTPEEEADVEGHAKDYDFGEHEFGKRDDDKDDDFEGHALRDTDLAEHEFGRKDDLEKDQDLA